MTTLVKPPSPEILRNIRRAEFIKIRDRKKSAARAAAAAPKDPPKFANHVHLKAK